MLSVDDLDVSGATVLLRADLNVPLDGSGAITDDGRIRASLPTIRKLTSRGARVLIAAHLGRPKGADYAERAAGGPSLAPVAARLAELLGQKVPLAGDVAGESAAATAAALADGDVALLENVRFEPAETSKDDAERAGLARRLAALAQLYVGDGFGALHRKHASVYDVPALLPAAAGDLVADEVAVLQRLTRDPERPYVVVLGGAKPSDKLGVIANLLDQADRILIGGGMSYTFLTAQGHEMGRSLLEADKVDEVGQVLADAAARGVEIVLPVDLVGAADFAPDAAGRHLRRDRVPGRPGGRGHGPGHPRAVRGQAGRRRHGVLERPGRRVRVPGVRGGHAGRCPGHRQGAGADRGRRRRLRGRGAPARHPRGCLQPHLHWRRRQPGVPGGRHPAGPPGAGRRAGQGRDTT